jgi:hypothetical protein
VPIARPRVTLFTRAIPRSASVAFHVLQATNRLSKFYHGTNLWASQNIFSDLFKIGFPQYGRILGKTLWWRPQAPARQACPWGHSPSSSALCAVPMRLSRIGSHIKDEPCAKQRALLGVLSSRFSSVSRDIWSTSTFPIWNNTPLVGWYAYHPS